MRCPDASHATPLRQTFRTGATDFVTCSECGLAFRRHFPGAAELTSIYAQAYGTSNIQSCNTDQESGTAAVEKYLALLRRVCALPSPRVLDYGAATGEFVAKMRAAGIDADGIETADSARRYCQQVRGFALHADFGGLPGGAYDVVTMFEVIEHLTDLHGTLLRLRALIRPGGSLLVTTPNRHGLRARIEGGRWREARKRFHLFLFTWEGLEHHLTVCGFAQVRQLASPIASIHAPARRAYAALAEALGMPGSLVARARVG